MQVASHAEGQGGLAAAARPGQDDELAVVHIQADAPERRRGGATVSEG